MARQRKIWVVSELDVNGTLTTQVVPTRRWAFNILPPPETHTMVTEKDLKRIYFIHPIKPLDRPLCSIEGHTNICLIQR